MIYRSIIAIWFATYLSIGFACADTAEDSFSKLSRDALEARKSEIDAELAVLARASLNSGVGPIGYRSAWHFEPAHTEWLRIDLGTVERIDEIVLVPTLRRDPVLGFVADAFPQSFRVIAGLDGDAVGEVVAEFADTASLLPRIAPVFIPVDVEATWVKVESDSLSVRAYDGRYVFQLSEVMLFSGAKNVALRKQVTASSRSGSKIRSAWAVENAVDGILPYLMNAAQGEKSLPMISGLKEALLQVTVDLEQSYPINGFLLHAVNQGDTRPQSFPGDFGIPKRFRIEGANQIDFSDATTLLNVSLESEYEMGPIMEWSFPAADCRYVRLTSIEPYYFNAFGQRGGRIGFAELEVLSDARNVALGKPVTTSFSHPYSEALTDGRNLYGNILPMRQWLKELERRHDLEIDRPHVIRELAKRYAAQSNNIRRLVLLAVVLIIGIGLMYFYGRVLRQRQETRIRERIAANLHDELGANLHAIGLLGDLAKESVDSREDLIDMVDRIRGLSKRTGVAAMNCANMLEAEGLCEDLVLEMQRDAGRLLGDLEHEISFVGKAILRDLKRRTQIDLLMFYRECLVNVIRHSGASRVVTEVSADQKLISFVITDNGNGLDGRVPKALRRRARLLNAKFSAEHNDDGVGTRITLKLKRHKWGLKGWKR